jgi:peptidoglycan/xylan/chitin deacetylase (PgdA/CDA1 family)
MKPAYLAGYDTEQPTCVEGVRALVKIHRKLRIPATFFIVGLLAEHNDEEFKDLLSGDLFEVASHSYTHCALQAARPEVVRSELQRTQDVLREIFGYAPVGFRTPGGVVAGYRGDRERLAVFAELGFEYVSSQGWGPGKTLPAPIVPPYTYAAEGFPHLIEIPFHGWHENLLTKVHPWQSPSQPLKPGAPRTREEWLVPFLSELAATMSQSLPFYGPTMHPWSLRRFDPECGQVEALLLAAQDRGMEFMKFRDFARRFSER